MARNDSTNNLVRREAPRSPEPRGNEQRDQGTDPLTAPLGRFALANGSSALLSPEWERALRICLHDQPLAHTLFKEKPVVMMPVSRPIETPHPGLYTCEQFERAKSTLFAAHREHAPANARFAMILTPAPNDTCELIVIDRVACQGILSRQSEMFEAVFGREKPTVEGLERRIEANGGNLLAAFGGNHLLCGVVLGFPIRDCLDFDLYCRTGEALDDPRAASVRAQMEQRHKLVGALPMSREHFDVKTPCWATFQPLETRDRLDRQIAAEREELRQLASGPDFPRIVAARLLEPRGAS